MVKSYLKFEQAKNFGRICSPSSNIVWTISGPSAKVGSGSAYVAANEDVLAWDLKKGEIISRWTAADISAQVTCIAQSQTDPDIFAVGYEDGKIRLWDAQTSTIILTFNGHKSAVTHFCFDSAGVRLASGSKDTDIILWDLVGEVGLFKLRGHKDQITSLNFLSSQDSFLLSTSKDALIKVWDLTTQHCIETHVAQSNGECWSLGLSPTKDGCITGGNEGELRVWLIDTAGLSVNGKILHSRGTFYRNGKDRTTSISFSSSKDLLMVHGSEKAVELFRIRSDEEVRKSLNRKRKRLQATEPEESITDVIVPYVIIRTTGKVSATDWVDAKSTSLVVATSNNQIEVYAVPDGTPSDYARTLSIDTPGHRTDMRCLSLSSDDRMLASASHGMLKIWNTRTQSCLRSLECGYAICMTFLPGDKIVVVGTREGTLEIFDIASSVLIDTIQAHEKDIWSISLHPDGKSIVTGSADSSVKFWDLKVVQDQVLGTNRTVSRLTLIHVRTLKNADDVLATAFSPDGRLLAVSTLDNTVKVFFVDSLKLFLSLYGHKLPVLAMDISYDSKLIITSSADKNVRIWGLDFGDCHKTFFAHHDSILAVAFVPNNEQGSGHQFFSASKDRVIKHYDGDKFEQIQKLSGHHGEIWAMCIARSGEFIVTASHDKSIRIWEQRDEPIFLEEEREKELEELYENTLISNLEDGEDKNDVTEVGKQSVQTLMAGERIAEALELGFEDLESAQRKGYQRNPVFLANNNISASHYVYNVVSKIPSASLQDALLVLSFSQLPALFSFLGIWAAEGRNTPLTCRILYFMIKTHQKQLVSSTMMKLKLEEVKQQLRARLRQQKHELGFNLAGLRVTARRLDDQAASYFVDTSSLADVSTTRGTKRTFLSVA